MQTLERTREHNGNVGRRKALQYRSLFLFRASSRFRYRIVRLVNSALFEAIILASILLSSCIMTARKTTHIVVIDIILTLIFLFELVAKVISYGLALHPGAYLRDPLNVLDASIVLAGKLPFYTLMIAVKQVLQGSLMFTSTYDVQSLP